MSLSKKSILETSLCKSPHVLLVIEAVRSCKHPVGIQQDASTCMVPAAVVDHEDLEADHPRPGPVLRRLPSNNPESPLQVLPEP
jgi:hypothetical protein